jgi:16S rRNA A1518/A1519 N6-dimethyltransferase RsmA/KsgA/DIM1 with predicted DNA glycosylase/AP lyase activity
VTPSNLRTPPPAVGSKVILLEPKEPKTLPETIFWEFLRQKDKIAKNALREAIIRGFDRLGKVATKNEARKALEILKMENELELRVSCLSGEDLLRIRQFLEDIKL